MMRPDVNRHNRVCGCGTQAYAVLMAGNSRNRRTRRVPLCPKHLAAHAAQVQRRNAAIMRAWHAS